MNILKTKRVKMSLDAIQNDMTRDEMKGIIAGSSINNGCMQGSNYSYDQNAYNISMSGSRGFLWRY